MKKRIVFAALCAGVVALAVPAQAAGIHIHIGIGVGSSTKSHLEFFTDTPNVPSDPNSDAGTEVNSTAGWEGDRFTSDKQSVEIVTEDNLGAEYSYAGFAPNVTGLEGKPLSALQKLSMKYRVNYTAGGSPRMNVVMSDGTYVTADWPNCDATADPTSYHSVNILTDCEYDLPATMGTPHFTTWNQVLTHYTGETISYFFLIVEQGPTVARFDDIQIGGCLYKKAGNIRCKN